MTIETDRLSPTEERANELGEFDPRVSPALALQTYESFAGGPSRRADKDAFAAGETFHLEMTYPLLDPKVIAAQRAELIDLKIKAGRRFGEDSLTVSSIEYRMQETDFLDSAVRLNQSAQADDQEAHEADARNYVALVEALYGKPDQAVIDSMLYDLRRRYSTDDPRIQNLWAELESGFSVQLADGEDIRIPALTIPTEAAPLPRLSEKAAELLAAEWQLAFPAVSEARTLLADIKAAKTGLDLGYEHTEVLFDGRMVAELFRIAAQGIAHHHGVAPFDVIEDEHGTSAAWSSENQAVVVGLDRSELNGEWDVVRETGMHESAHGLKSANGIKAGDPAMATGAFSRNTDGSYTEYLTYEEGNNKLGEQVTSPSVDGDLKAPLEDSYNLYLFAGLLYRGFDDRQIKEIGVKLITIERLANEPTLDQATLEVQLSERMAMRAERLLRGTPVTSGVLVDGHKPVFTKDIAYYKGTLVATEFWNGIVEEAIAKGNDAHNDAIANGATIVQAEHSRRLATRGYVHKMFEIQNQGKVDPSSPRQLAAATAAYERAVTVVEASTRL